MGVMNTTHQNLLFACTTSDSMNLSPKSILMRAISILPESIQVRFRKSHYFRKLRQARLTDEPDLAAIALLTRPGDTVFDIGANFGLFTRFLSESVGSEGRVYSFEPTLDMFEVIVNNCQLLGLKNTRVFRIALSDHSGLAEMRIPVWEDGTLNHYEASLEQSISSSPTGRTLQVPVCSLDDFCSEHQVNRVDFIKCDVEGHELAVLDGARATLLRHRPTVLIEVNDPLGSSSHGEKVLKKIRELNYEILVVKDDLLEPWDSVEVCVNYVLKPV